MKANFDMFWEALGSLWRALGSDTIVVCLNLSINQIRVDILYCLNYNRGSKNNLNTQTPHTRTYSHTRTTTGTQIDRISNKCVIVNLHQHRNNFISLLLKYLKSFTNKKQSFRENKNFHSFKKFKQLKTD